MSANSVSALLPFLPEDLRDAYLHAKRVGYLALSESKLLSDYDIPPHLTVIRTEFWAEAKEASEENRAFNFIKVLRKLGIGFEYFYPFITSKPECIAFLMIPPLEYNLRVSEALEVSMIKLRGVVASKLTLPDGTMDVEQVDRVIEIAKMLDERVHGKAVQRTVNRDIVQNIEGGKSIKEIEGEVLSTNPLEDLDAKIRQLEGKRVEQVKQDTSEFE